MGSEWRTFANDSDAKDNSRVGATEVSVMLARFLAALSHSARVQRLSRLFAVGSFSRRQRLVHYDWQSDGLSRIRRQRQPALSQPKHGKTHHSRSAFGSNCFHNSRHLARVLGERVREGQAQGEPRHQGNGRAPLGRPVHHRKAASSSLRLHFDD